MMRTGFLCIAMAALMSGEPAFSMGDSSETALEELNRLVTAHANESSDPRLLARLSALCLDVGKDVYTDETQRRAAYEEGARIAKRALDLQDTNAEAHYLYAANLGSAAQLKGLTASALTVRELKRHVTRALELKPDHAPSLHMMGRMLDELPWMLGGDADAALTYLKRAVDADPAYHHARLDLAKAYLKRNDRGSALRELSELIGIDDASSHVADRYQKEGASLLASLQERERPRR
jgi:tetratricopeptide (TPR) repeat protein